MSADASGHWITVALIKDNRLVREGIVTVLNRFPDIRVVAAGPGGDHAALRDHNPRVVLLDLDLEHGDSLRAALEIREEFPDARVIAMNLLPAREEILELIAAGVSGFIMTDATLEEVAETIRSVAAGNEVLPARMTGALFSEIAREGGSHGEVTEDLEGARLTPREVEVVGLIAEGLSNKAISKRLYISPHTVKSHLRNLMEKLALHSRLQIAAYAHQLARATDAGVDALPGVGYANVVPAEPAVTAGGVQASLTRSPHPSPGTRWSGSSHPLRRSDRARNTFANHVALTPPSYQ